jgi:hypothetical protein
VLFKLNAVGPVVAGADEVLSNVVLGSSLNEATPVVGG